MPAAQSSARSSARPLAYGWLVFGLLAAGYLLVYFHRNSTAVVSLELQHDLATDGAGLGLLGAAYFYAYALMQPAAGLLADSWGPRRTVTAFFLVAGAGSIGLGLAPGLGWAVAARVLVGLGVAMHFVCTMKILTRWFAARQFAIMMGVLMAVGGLGVYTAATPLALLSSHLGWRGSFMAIGGVTLALAMAVWLVVRNRPEDLGLPAPEQPAGPAPTAKVGLWAGMRSVLGRGRFWPLAVWYFCSMGFFFSFSGLWAGHWLRQVYGLSQAAAGGVLSMVALGMILGSPALSFLSQSVLRSRKKVMVGSSALNLLLSLPLVWLTDQLSLPMLYLLLFLLGASLGSVVVVGFTACKELFPIEIAGTATGTLNIFPFLGGSALPPLVGWLLQSQSGGGAVFSTQAYSQAFLAYVACALLALIAACFMQETLTGPLAPKPTRRI